MIRHLALFTVVDEKKAEKDALIAEAAVRLAPLVGQVPGLRSIAVHTDELGEGNYDFAIIADMDDLDAVVGSTPPTPPMSRPHRSSGRSAASEPSSTTRSETPANAPMAASTAVIPAADLAGGDCRMSLGSSYSVIMTDEAVDPGGSGPAHRRRGERGITAAAARGYAHVPAHSAEHGARQRDDELPLVRADVLGLPRDEIGSGDRCDRRRIHAARRGVQHVLLGTLVDRFRSTRSCCGPRLARS